MIRPGVAPSRASGPSCMREVLDAQRCTQFRCVRASKRIFRKTFKGVLVTMGGLRLCPGVPFYTGKELADSAVETSGQPCEPQPAVDSHRGNRNCLFGITVPTRGRGQLSICKKCDNAGEAVRKVRELGLERRLWTDHPRRLQGFPTLGRALHVYL